MTAQLVTDALTMAIWRSGKPEALLHHSDPAANTPASSSRALMVDHGVICSMSCSGNVWDNAAMESFFSRQKQSAQHAKRIGRATKQRPTCSITSNASTMLNVGIRPSAI